MPNVIWTKCSVSVFGKMKLMIRAEHFLPAYIESKIREASVSERQRNNCINICEQIDFLEHNLISDCFLRVVPLVQKRLSPAVQRLTFYLSQVQGELFRSSLSSLILSKKVSRLFQVYICRWWSVIREIVITTQTTHTNCLNNPALNSAGF